MRGTTVDHVQDHLERQTDDQLADWLLELERSYESHRSIAVWHTICLIRREQDGRYESTPGADGPGGYNR